MLKTTFRSIVVVTALLAGSAVSAASITASNGGTVIAAPAMVGEDDPINTSIQAFNEGTGVFLAAALGVDGGSIAAGTLVDSHMVFLNSDGQTRIEASATFTFDQVILGIMSSQNGANLFLSDNIVNGGTTYLPGGYGNNRGLESNDSVTQNGLYSLDFDLIVTEPGDWVRVITASAAPVPVPAGLVLLPTGIAAFAAMRRRKARKAA